MYKWLGNDYTTAKKMLDVGRKIWPHKHWFMSNEGRTDGKWDVVANHK